MAEERSFADELAKLAVLRDRGVLSSEEFEAQKARLLEATTHKEPVASNQRPQYPPPITGMGAGPAPSPVYLSAGPPRSPSTLPVGAWLAIIGGGLAAVGSFLPWVSFVVPLGGSLTRNGFQLGQNSSFSLDGAGILVLGIITVAVGIARLTRTSLPRFMQRSTVVSGIAIAVWCLLEIPSMNDLIHSAQNASSLIIGSVGFGLYLAIVGGVVAVVGGLVLRGKQAA